MKLFLKCKIETPWFGKKSQRRLKVTIECISDGDFVGDSFFFFGNCQWVLSLKEVKKVFHKFHLIGYTLRWFSGSRGSSEYINGPWPRTKNGYENVDVKQCFGCWVHQKSLFSGSENSDLPGHKWIWKCRGQGLSRVWSWACAINQSEAIWAADKPRPSACPVAANAFRALFRLNPILNKVSKGVLLEMVEFRETDRAHDRGGEDILSFHE